MSGKYTLGNFYTSKQWCLLMIQIKHDRLNDEGQLICEHCGKPIVRAYDCIGHHIEELTEENVNDVEISLNPENVMLVHHRCHNKIHHKLSYNHYHRDVWLVYGAPLSGKSTYVNGVREDGDLIIDMDSIWQAVSGCERYIKPDKLRSIVFGIRDKLIEDVRYRRGKWQRAYIIGGYPLISDRDRLCRELGAREVFIDISRDECLLRLDRLDDNDLRDKKQWKKFIEGWFDTYTGPPV